MSVETAGVCIPPTNTSCELVPVTWNSVLINTLLSCIALITVILNLLVVISIAHFRQRQYCIDIPYGCFLAVLFILSPCSQCCNMSSWTLAIIIISLSRHLQTPTNLILLSLAVSDFLVGFTAMPFATMLLQTCGVLRKISCLSNVFNFILTSASVGNMVLISVDRYMAICCPLHYSSMITPNRVKISVSLCWICSLIYSMVFLKDMWSKSCNYNCIIIINHISGIVDLIITFIGPITVIIVLYTRVFLMAVSQARRMRSQISTITSNTVTVKKSELRAARTLGIIILVFIICFLPVYLRSIMGEEITDVEDIFPHLWLFYCNSTINPLIYVFLYPNFRKSLKLIVTFRCCRQGQMSQRL